MEINRKTVSRGKVDIIGKNYLLHKKRCKGKRGRNRERKKEIKRERERERERRKEGERGREEEAHRERD